MINFKVNTISTSDREGTFAIEPLESGFGHTLGQSLRRTLLNSLEGAAITAVKIEGISHQFSTISGISEDVIQIILNLKKVQLKVYSDKPIKMVLKVSGKKQVKAKDIDTLGSAEVINPELHIASLNTPSAKLNIEMSVDKGVGYVVADERKSSEIGIIPVDAIYSPVLSVNYQVEPTRVGRSTNFDKLILEVLTDGTIKPEVALEAAAKMLTAYFKQIWEPNPEEVVEATPTISDEVLKLSVEELDLPVRITNALKAVDINSVGELVATSKGQLMKAKNLGAQSLNLISQKLEERGLSLSEA